MSKPKGVISSLQGGSDTSDSKGNDTVEDKKNLKAKDYQEKFKSVSSYKTFLETMIQRLEQATDNSREPQLIKMQSLYQILFTRKKKLKFETLLRCEKVLTSLYQKIEKNTLLPDKSKKKLEVDIRENESLGTDTESSGTVTSATFTSEASTSTIKSSAPAKILKEAPSIESTKNNTLTTINKTLTKKDVKIKPSLDNLISLNKDPSSLKTDVSVINKVKNKDSDKKKDINTTQSKVNEESRRKLCNIIKKQKQEESPKLQKSKGFDKEINTHCDNLPNKEINFDSSKFKETPENLIISTSDTSIPISSDTVQEYCFENVDKDDRKRYISRDVQNIIKSDQSVEKEKQVKGSIDLYKTNSMSMSENAHSFGNVLIGNMSSECVVSDHREMLSGNAHVSAPSFEKENIHLSALKDTHSESTQLLLSSENKPHKEFLSPENKPQSVRDKLKEQISAVHKVGTSSGGALRGLMNRDDKTIATNRMANLKAGTILDLIGKEKPNISRHTQNKAKPNLKKPNEEIPKQHIPSTPLASNDCNTNNIPHLGLDSSNTLAALTKMNPKELERIVKDHILKLPNSSEAVKDFSNNSNSERGRLFSDSRGELHKFGNVPTNSTKYEIPKNYNNPIVPPIIKYPQQNNLKYVYNEGSLRGNQSFAYNTNVEPVDYNNPVYKKLDNICNRNQHYGKYNKPASGLYTRNLNHYQQNSHGQADRNKWGHRPSASADLNSTYNVPNRNSHNHNCTSKNLNTARENRTMELDQCNKILMSQRPLSSRDPRRRSIDETMNRSNVGRTEQPRSSRSIDPRLSRDFKRSNHDYISNRDPRMRDKTYPTISNRQNFSYEKNNEINTEQDFKSKLISPLEKLYSPLNEFKTGKGYGPQKFRIPKLKTSNTQINDKLLKNKALYIDSSDQNKTFVKDEYKHNRNKSHFMKKEIELSFPREPRSTELDADLSVDNQEDLRDSYYNDSDDEIRPPKSSRSKRYHWDDTEESRSSDCKPLDKKEEMANKDKQKNSTDKLKMKNNEVKKSKGNSSTKSKTVMKVEHKEETEIKRKDEPKEIDENCTSNDSSPEISNSYNENSTKLSLEPEVIEKKDNTTAAQKKTEQEINDMFQSSLWELLPYEDRKTLYVKLKENLNAEKLKKIRKIIESNTDDEEGDETKRSNSSMVSEQESCHSSSLRKDEKNQSLGDFPEQNENPDSSQVEKEPKVTLVVNQDEFQIVKKIREVKYTTHFKNKHIDENKVCIEDNDRILTDYKVGIEAENKEEILLKVHEQTKNKKTPVKKGRKKKKYTKRVNKKVKNLALTSFIELDVQNLSKSTVKPKKKQKNELEKLQEDIRDMFISKGVVSATGLRLCRLRKEIDTGETSDHQVRSHDLRVNRGNMKDKKFDLSDESDNEEKHSEEFQVQDKNSDLDKVVDKNVESSKEDKEDVLKSNISLHKSGVNYKSLKCDVPSCDTVGLPVVMLTKTDIAKFEKKNVDSGIIDEVHFQKENEIVGSCVSPLEKNLNVASDLKKMAKSVTLKYKKNRNKSTIIQKNLENNVKKRSPKVKNVKLPDEIESMDDMYYFQTNENEIHSCRICSYEGKLMARHYVMKHPKDEVMISRISPDSAKQAVEESYAKNFKEHTFVSSSDKNEFKCRMCTRVFLKAVLFYDHIGFHTGEYRYACNKCTYKTSSKSGLASHLVTLHKSSDCKKSIQIKGTSYDDLPNGNIILGYLCSECNFVQLLSKNLEEHINRAHGDLSKPPKAIVINLSKPFLESNKEYFNTDLNSEETKNDIKLYPESYIQTSNETNEPVLEIKIEHPTEITIMDVETNTDETGGFQVSKIIDQEEEEINEVNAEESYIEQDDVLNHRLSTEEIDTKEVDLSNDEPSMEANDFEEEVSSNKEKEIDLKVFVGFEKINTQNYELNIERERIMNAVVKKLKNRTKPQKDSVVDQIKTKLSLAEFDSSDVLKLDKKDISTENISSKNKSYLIREKVGDPINKYLPKENETPARRTLPERSCKDKGQITKNNLVNNLDEDSDSSNGELEAELQRYVDELAMSGSDHSELDDDLVSTVDINASSETNKNKPMANTITRLQDTLNRPDNSLNMSEIETTTIMDDDNVDPASSDFLKTLLLEPSLEMSIQEMYSHISNFNCTVVCEDILPLQVGPLEAFVSDSCIMYRCHPKCTFVSNSLVVFAEHIITHQTYAYCWDGKCLKCKINFIKEDKKQPLYALSSALSHMLKCHLSKESNYVDAPNLISKGLYPAGIRPPPPVIPLADLYRHVTNEPPKPKTPLLRVRRLSGDKLSAPAAENSLTVQQAQGVPINVIPDNSLTDIHCYERINCQIIESTDCQIIESTEPPEPTAVRAHSPAVEDDACNFLRIESVVSLDPESATDFPQDVEESNECSDNSTVSNKLSGNYITLIPQSSTNQSITLIPIDESVLNSQSCNLIPVKIGNNISQYNFTPINTSPNVSPQKYITLPSPAETTGNDNLSQNYITLSTVNSCINLYDQGYLGTENTEADISKQNVTNQTTFAEQKNLKGRTGNKSTKSATKTKEFRKSVGDLKSVASYKEMLIPTKLRHFYKCMGHTCSFTCANIEKAAVHFEQHRSLQLNEDPEKSWRFCPYCYDTYECARDYCIHMKKEHGHSNMQCAYCFYRAATLGNVLYHQNTSHITEKVMVLECKTQGIPPYSPFKVKFDQYIRPYICRQGKCSVYTFIAECFRQHVEQQHADLNTFVCHLCVGFTARLDRLFEHYEVHAISMYQCVYCLFGTATEDEIRDHLCYSHPNRNPSAIKRVDMSKIPGQSPVPNINFERLKRINFKELEEQTYTVIPFPPNEDEDVTTVDVPHDSLQTEPETIAIDDDIQIVKTVNKADRVTCVIVLDSSDDDDECVVVNETNNKRKKSPERDISCVKQNDDEPETKKPRKCSNEGVQSEEPVLQSQEEPLIDEQVILTKNKDLSPQKSSIETNLAAHNISADETQESSGLTGKALFRCGYLGCYYGAQDSTVLKDHFPVCENAVHSAMLRCVHCNRMFKYTSSYVEHIRVHGTSRYRCSLCEFKAPIYHRVSAHMKQVHRINNTKVEPMNPREKNHDTDQFVCIPKVNSSSKGGKGNSKKTNKSNSQTKFTLTDIDKIPYQSIFPAPLGCASCSYETKVRSNLVQHLTLHAAGHSVPQEELVNPVPCLEKKEKMFDKMINLASSSHKNTEKSVLQDLKQDVQVHFPMFVPPNQRYVCHAEGCTYVTIDDNMLRSHIRTLHNEEITYRCPHCPFSHPASLMPLEKLSTHLKMHDSKLYACSACNYYHFSRYLVEKHVYDKHVELAAALKVIRENIVPQSNLQEEEECSHDAGGSTTDNLSTLKVKGYNQNTAEKKIWHCKMCKFRSDEEKSIRTHSRKVHGMACQYKCRLCVYESDKFHNFEDHFPKDHPNLPMQIITSFNKVIDTPSASISDTTCSGPQTIKTYWRRNSNSVRHIRGILLDEEITDVSNTTTSSSQPAVPLTPKEPDSIVPHKKFGSYGEPGPGNMYQCPKCNLCYKYKSELKAHLYRELDYTPWVCTHCGKTSKDKGTIAKHIKIVHDRDIGVDLILLHQPNQELEDWVEKVICLQHNVIKQNVIEPSAKIVKKKRFSPVDKNNQPIGNTSKRPSTGSVQQPQFQKKKSDTKESNFLCGYCSTGTVLRKSLRAHQLKKHPDRPLLILTSDGTPEVVKRKHVNSKIININNRLVGKDKGRHEKEKCQSTKGSCDGPYYTCYYCKWSSQSLPAVKEHWELLHKASVYLLNGCQKPGTGVKFLCNKSKYSSELEYSCNWCTKQGLISTLKEHHLKEHASLKFKVLQAQKQTYNLKYKCSKCELISYSRDVLHRHCIVEHKQTNVDYTIVDSSKEANGDIDNNETKASLGNIEHYKCPRCLFSSQMYRNVVRHLNKHFRSYYCGVCNHKYLSTPGLRHHMQLKHSGSSVKPNIVQASDTDIESIKNQITVIQVSESKETVAEMLQEPEADIHVTDKVVQNLDSLVNEVAETKGNKTSSVSEYPSSAEKTVKSQNTLSRSKLIQSGKVKIIRLRNNCTKINNKILKARSIARITKNRNKDMSSRNLPLNPNETVLFKSRGKMLKFTVRKFCKLFDVMYPKTHIESLVVNP